MQEQYRLLVDEQLICGTQIHVGVADRDVAVEIGQRIARDLPVLLALSASSPYWNGQDTGYASIRTIIWQRWPSAGSPGRVNSAAEYDQLRRRPDQLRRHRRRQDGLLRRPAVRARAHPGAAGLRRLPAGRRRRPHRRPLPRHGPRGRARHRGRPPVRRPARATAPRRHLAGRPQRPVPAARRRHRPAATAARARRRPRPGRPAPSAAGGVRRLGDRQRAHRDGAGPRQLRRPAARRLRRTGQPRGRHAARRRGEPRPRRAGRRRPAGPPPVPGPGRRRGPRARLRRRARPTAGSSRRSSELGPAELAGAGRRPRRLGRPAGPDLRPWTARSARSPSTCSPGCSARTSGRAWRPA